MLATIILIAIGSAIISGVISFSCAVNRVAEGHKKCKYCGANFKIETEKVYIVSVSSKEFPFVREYYNAIDCPVCRSQHKLSQRLLEVQRNEKN